MENPLQSVTNALDVISMLAREADLTLTDIAGRLRTSTSATHRLLVTLQQNGVVTRSSNTKRYRLGLRLWEIGVAALHGFTVRDLALHHLPRLAEQCEETVNFSIYERGDVLYLDQVDNRAAGSRHLPVALRLPAHLSAAGKVLLAHLPEEEVERFCRTGLAGATQHTITSPDRLREELAEIRRQGFAINRGEWHPDACGVAVPVLDATGYAIAAIGVACPASRFSSAWVEQVTLPALDHARDISAALGYRGSSAGWPGIS
ncbi:MAG: IclR family transcriptional regulator [Dehalococcoidia bacterium]